MALASMDTSGTFPKVNKNSKLCEHDTVTCEIVGDNCSTELCSTAIWHETIDKGNSVVVCMRELLHSGGNKNIEHREVVDDYEISCCTDCDDDQVSAFNVSSDESGVCYGKFGMEGACNHRGDKENSSSDMVRQEKGCNVDDKLNTSDLAVEKSADSDIGHTGCHLIGRENNYSDHHMQKRQEDDDSGENKLAQCVILLKEMCQHVIDQTVTDNSKTSDSSNVIVKSPSADVGGNSIEIGSEVERTVSKVASCVSESTTEKHAVEEGEMSTVAKDASEVPVSAASVHQPTTQCGVLTSSVPRVHRPRMGSYGSPPPSSPMSRNASANHFCAVTESSASGPDDDASKQQQYIVNVHVNPGETFSVCVSDQVQLIQGPATVRMVSNNGPPLPMPMQVPPGHMVQQIIDENGILTNVILSSQPPGIMAPPMMVGYYSGPTGPPYTPYCGPTGYGPPPPPFSHVPYAVHHHPAAAVHPPANNSVSAGAGVPGGVSPGPASSHGALHGLPPAAPHAHLHPVMTGVVPSMHPPHMVGGVNGMPPLHHNHCVDAASPPHPGLPSHSLADDRLPPRIKSRLPPKFQNHKHITNFFGNHAPRHSIPNINGLSVSRLEPPSESSSSEEQEHVAEERRLMAEQLSKMPIPKVLDIEARSALIVLTPPDFSYPSLDVDVSELQFELALSEHKDGKFTTVYSGDATEITLRDLKPATDYYLKVHSILDDMHGSSPECVSFKTLCCEPESPLPPKLQSRTVSSVGLKWNVAVDNGAKITAYILEFDQGSSGSKFVEVYCGFQRQYKVTGLAGSTSYLFRLAAVNRFGKSDYSQPVSFSTCGIIPLQPDPPMLSERFVNMLTISWIRRPGDDIFILHMDDESTGQGFLLAYEGPDLSYTIRGLRRNAEYRFRLQASNEEGCSPWSDTVQYRTLCDRPRPPPRPQVKGKVHQHNFRVVWDPPDDTGGVSHYIVQMDNGNGYAVVHSGPGREYVADGLHPGRTYRVRVCCVAADKQSDWSPVLTVTTQCVPPAVCQRLRIHGQPQPTALRICWDTPELSTGSSASEYELLMTWPDRQTTTEVYRGNRNEAVVTDLQPGRSYIFQVRALNHAGAGPWSDSTELSTCASIPDGPPAPLVVCKSPRVAQISWCKPAENGANITEYRLEWQQRPDLDFSLLYCGMSLTAEVSELNPATVYSFRVQAVNSAGAGPFSVATSCTTLPSSPAPVVNIQVVPAATTAMVTWQPSDANGSRVCGYNIEIDDRPCIAVEASQIEYSVDDLQPETLYRLRIRAVNAIGCGPFSAPVKFKTRSLPPLPPGIECIAFASTSLKLKWRDGRSSDSSLYNLEIRRDDGSYHSIYRGSGHSYKVTKLTELTEYSFRICASNDAGNGPYSAVCRFSTTRSPPPAIRTIKVSCITTDSCVVEWTPVRSATESSIVYVLELASSRDQVYRQMYRGSLCTFELTRLLHSTEYRVRVCAVRQSAEIGGSCYELVGSFGPPATFATVTFKPLRSNSLNCARGGSTTGSGSSSVHPNVPRCSDQHWAILILVSFTVCAVLIAFLTQQVLSYAASSSSGVSNSISQASGLSDKLLTSAGMTDTDENRN